MKVLSNLSFYSVNVSLAALLEKIGQLHNLVIFLITKNAENSIDPLGNYMQTTIKITFLLQNHDLTLNLLLWNCNKRASCHLQTCLHNHCYTLSLFKPVLWNNDSNYSGLLKSPGYLIGTVYFGLTGK